jgi:hypothetical protein
MAIGIKSTGVSIVVTLAETSINCNGNEVGGAVIPRAIIIMTLALRYSFMPLSHDS